MIAQRLSRSISDTDLWDAIVDRCSSHDSWPPRPQLAAVRAKNAAQADSPLENVAGLLKQDFRFFPIVRGNKDMLSVEGADHEHADALSG